MAIASPEKREASCMYCGGPLAKIARGEDIFPRAIGCARSIKVVCAACNNRVLSTLDKELVSHSPLRLAMPPTWQKRGEEVWNYDADRDLAIEARMLPENEACVNWPQLIFSDLEKPIFVYDILETREIGVDRLVNTFRDCLATAIKSLGDQRPLWIWRRLVRIPRRGKLPPRAFARHVPNELVPGCHIECRFHGDVDKEVILESAKRWINRSGPHTREEGMGVIDPEGGYSYQPRMVLRSLVKIGLNLLASICTKTGVNHKTFSDAVNFVLHDRDAGPSFRDSGFVVNSDVRALSCPANSHLFRLMHDRNWALDCSFFGGTIGATVAFPGPSREEWRHAEIIAPVGSNRWKISKSPILLVRQMRRSDDLNEIVANSKHVNVKTELRIERKRHKGSPK